jgi:hypothetical protein
MPDTGAWVLLRHELPSGGHFDFMVGDGERLLTWRLEEEPSPGAALWAERIADHRLAYLDYEGPVSGDRGWVVRRDRGTYRRLVWQDDCLEVELEGQRLRGRVCLRRCGPGPRWLMEYAAPAGEHPAGA